jgi:hypothetical protein
MSSFWTTILSLLFGGSCKSDPCGWLLFGRTYTSQGPNGACTNTCVLFGAVTPGLTCGTCAAASGGRYNIDLAFSNVPSAHQGAFTSAKQRWESIIVADVPDVRSSTFSEAFSLGGCSYPRVIDDLHMCVFYDNAISDGLQGNLAYAVVEYIREDDSLLPVAGVIGFDPADIDRLIARNDFNLVIQHEMAHLMGLGTLWPLLGVTGSVRNNCPYQGIHGNAAYQRISGCSVVPTELDGQPNDGTFCSHFDEYCLQNEMMTGFLNRGSIISEITIASLQDLGYSVDFGQAEPFGRSNLGVGCTCDRRSRYLAGSAAATGAKESVVRETKLPSADVQAKATTFGREILSRNSGKALGSVVSQMVMVLVQEGDDIFSLAVQAA